VYGLGSALRYEPGQVLGYRLAGGLRYGLWYSLGCKARERERERENKRKKNWDMAMDMDWAMD